MYPREVILVQNIIVKVNDGFSSDKVIKKFKRLCDQFGVVKEYRKRSEYKKPSIRSKEKSEAAEKRRRKAAVKGRRFTKI